MDSENEKLEQLAHDLKALMEDLANERLINAKKIEKASPGGYPYGEGMHDGLRYAAAGLKSILQRYGMLKSS
jgi:hypothetical protein